MNISIIPHEQVKLKDLDDVEFLRRAAEIADFIFLLKGDMRRGAFADEARAELVRNYITLRPHIEQTAMLAGAAIVHEAIHNRSVSVLGTTTLIFGESLTHALRDWYACRGEKPPSTDMPTTLVKAPEIKHEL